MRSCLNARLLIICFFFFLATGCAGPSEYELTRYQLKLASKQLNVDLVFSRADAAR